MRNLLSANFLRLRKSNLFWGLLAFSFGFGAWTAFDYYQMNQYDRIPLDGAFFLYPLIAALITAVFIPLFLGREYSDGALRNKVAAGYARPNIYAANLLTGTAAALLFCGAYMAAVTAVGTPLVGFIEIDMKQAVGMILGSLLTMAAFCALFTLLTMVCSRKAVSAAVCILSAFLLLIASIFLRSRLEAPKYYRPYSLSANGEVVWGDQAVNPQYLSGTQRAVCNFFYNLLPSSQAVQYSSQQAENLYQMPLYALIVIASSTGTGITLFRRKDLK